jgi:hypothetical protein
MSSDNTDSNSETHDAHDMSGFQNVLRDIQNDTQSFQTLRPANPTPDREIGLPGEQAGLETLGGNPPLRRPSNPTPSRGRRTDDEFPPQATGSFTTATGNAHDTLSDLLEAIDRVADHGRTSILERDQQHFQQLEEEERKRYNAEELKRTGIHPSKRTEDDFLRSPPPESVVRSREEAYRNRAHADVQLMNAILAKWKGSIDREVDNTVRLEVERDLNRVNQLMEPYHSADGPMSGVSYDVCSADNARLTAISIDFRSIRSTYFPPHELDAANNVEPTPAEQQRRRSIIRQVSGLVRLMSRRGSGTGSLARSEEPPSSRPSSPLDRVSGFIRSLSRRGSRQSRANSPAEQASTAAGEPAGIAGENLPSSPPPAPRPGFAQLHDPQPPPNIPE